MFGMIGDIVKGATSIGNMFSLVGILEKAADAFGLPDWFGDVMGMIADAKTGNWVGVLDHVKDLAENAQEGEGKTAYPSCEDRGFDFGSILGKVGGGLTKTVEDAGEFNNPNWVRA